VYDVFVVGSRDPSPMGQMHLATALATHFQAPVAQVAQGIADRNLRTGQALDAPRAQALVQQLAGLGAIAELRPSLLARSPADTRVSGPPTGMAPVGTPSGLGPSPSSGARTIGARGPDAFSVPTDTGPLPLPHQLPTATAMSVPSQRDPFAPPDDQTGRLDLGLPGPTTSSDDLLPKRPSRSVPGASALNLSRMSADSTESGVELGEDAAKLHTVRCPIHGLFYDKRKASGCRKCLAPAAEVARHVEAQQQPQRLLGLRDNPVRRGFLGLAVALGVGFIPAAYHALKLGTGEVIAVRSEQEQLSKRAGTEDVLKRYDELEEKIGEARTRAMRNTLLVWVAVSGGAMIAWYRIT
jgi:hypothetical protein